MYLIDNRLLNAQRVVWLIQDGNYNDFPEIWSQYMNSVIEWNINVNNYQSQIAYSFSRDLSSELLADTDDLNNEIPNSIHYKFYRMHELILKVRACFYSGCDKTNDLENLRSIFSIFIDKKFRFFDSLNNSLKEKPKTYKDIEL